MIRVALKGLLGRKLRTAFENHSAATENAPFAAMEDPARKLYALQFHPEVAHTPRGEEILANFLFRIAGAKPSWTMHSFVEQAVGELLQRVGRSFGLGVFQRRLVALGDLQHALPEGAALIDTPGMRELQLWASQESVDAVFDQMPAVATHVKLIDAPAPLDSLSGHDRRRAGFAWFNLCG